jgi:hypothetical protein
MPTLPQQPAISLTSDPLTYPYLHLPAPACSLACWLTYFTYVCCMYMYDYLDKKPTVYLHSNNPIVLTEFSNLDLDDLE